MADLVDARRAGVARPPAKCQAAKPPSLHALSRLRQHVLTFQFILYNYHQYINLIAYCKECCDVLTQMN